MNRAQAIDIESGNQVALETTDGQVLLESGLLLGFDTQKELNDAVAGSIGAYHKPSSGIPKADLNSSVQTSLGKADTALQEHQSLSNYYTQAEIDAMIGNIEDALDEIIGV